MITPEEVRQKRFKTALIGYHVKEVDAFLLSMAEEVEKLTDGLDKMREEIRSLTGDLDLYKGREESILKTMMSSQKVCDDMKKNAERESQIILSEAELKAEKVFAAAEQRLRVIEGDIKEMQRQKIKFEEALRSSLTTHLKLLDISKEDTLAGNIADKGN